MHDALCVDESVSGPTVIWIVIIHVHKANTKLLMWVYQDQIFNSACANIFITEKMNVHLKQAHSLIS